MSERDLIEELLAGFEDQHPFALTKHDQGLALATLTFAASNYATTIARLSEALAEAEKKGAEAEEAKRAERHRIFRLLWDHSEHVNAYSLGLLVKDDASVIKALPPRDLSQGGQHG